MELMQSKWTDDIILVDYKMEEGTYAATVVYLGDLEESKFRVGEYREDWPVEDFEVYPNKFSVCLCHGFDNSERRL